MTEEQLKAIEERMERADSMNLTNAVHDSDGCTYADYTFAEWAMDDITALIREVRTLQVKLTAANALLDDTHTKAVQA